MISSELLLGLLAFLSAFLLIIGAGSLVLFLLYKDHWRTVTRLNDLAADSAGPAKSAGNNPLASLLPSLGELLVPRTGSRLAALKQRLIQAGYYSANAVKFYLGVHLVSCIAMPAAVITPLLLFQVLPIWQGCLCAFAGLCIGWLLPGWWLKFKQTKRRRQLRQAFPDAIDMMVLCVDGGISLQAAIQRVSADLHLAHPVLGGEMNIVQREIEMGLPAGDAMMHFAERSTLDEVRNLASLLVQSDRYGASVTDALRIAADDLRIQRKQEAEENAQKAAVKILFPMLLCIFPIIFIVLLGPAAIQIYKLFK